MSGTVPPLYSLLYINYNFFYMNVSIAVSGEVKESVEVTLASHRNVALLAK